MMNRFVLIIIFIFHGIHCGNAQTIKTSAQQVSLLCNIPCTSVKDQFVSSTCWSFAGNSFLESELIKKGISGIDLSEMYSARMAWMQKIILHLQNNGLNCLTPGGQFHNIQWVLRNFGMVPENIYNGKPGGKINHDHSLLDTAMTRYLAKLVKSKIKEPTSENWKYINQLLDKYLGKLPAKFTVDQKEYSPVNYLKNYLKLNPEDYVEIISYTHHPFYKGYVFENKYNYSYDKYMNVPFKDFISITDSALLKGYSVLWNGDVTDAGFDFYNSAAFLPDTFQNLIASRQATFADSSSYMDHMMHIVGLSRDELGHKWYYIKNSWGKGNELGGYILMDENYFAIKTAAIVVNKNAIPLVIRKKMNL